MSSNGKTLKAVVIVAGLGVLAIAATMALRSLQGVYARNEFLAMRKVGVSAGMPSSHFEVFRRVETKDNAAPFILAAGEIQPPVPTVPHKSGSLRKVWRIEQPGDLQILEKACDDASLYFGLLEQAAAKPDCAFKHDYERPLIETYPEFAVMKQGAKWLAVRASVRFERGDTKGALQDLQACVAIADHAGRGVEHIGGLVKIACKGIAELAAFDMLYKSNGSPEVVAGATRLAKTPYTADLNRCLRGEWVLWTSATSATGFAEMRDVFTVNQAFNPFARLSTPRFYQSLTDTLDQLIKADHVASNDSLTLAEKRRALENIEGNGIKSFFGRPPAHTYAKEYVLFINAQTKAVSSSQMLLAAANVYDYKNKHGKFPESLADAVTPVPTDTWVDKPLRYRIEGAGFVIWACGQDLKDDNGANGPDNEARLDQVVDMTSPNVKHFRTASGRTP